MKRAVEASEHPGPPAMKSQTSPCKVPSTAPVQLKDSSKPTTPQRKDSPGPTVKAKEILKPVSPQSMPLVQSGKPETTSASLKQSSPALDQKKIQEKQKMGSEKPLDQASQSGRKLSNATAASQQESGGLFGFAAPKSQPDASKPAETVSGKMFGFGSSIFSSASTLINSAVQDQHKTTPPVSPKMSPAKQTKPHSEEKLEQQKKTETPHQIKPPPPGQAKVDKAIIPLSPKTAKPGQSTCPLCKTDLIMGPKDLPNFNTCTECKNTVCNQCGFNPLPNETTVIQMHQLLLNVMYCTNLC